MNFYTTIYNIVKQIPPGRVATYGQVARLAGQIKAARVVGYALHVNPDQQHIPCHRVVNRFGDLAPSFAFGGQDVQKQLLEREGVAVGESYTVDLEKYQWER